jgi:hypothetical protein
MAAFNCAEVQCGTIDATKWLPTQFGLVVSNVDADLLSYAHIRNKPELAAWLIERFGLIYGAA